MADDAPATDPVGSTTTTEVMRSADLALAHLHLRMGSLALARAELEALAGRDALDEAGLADLAEARWRTGDVAGGGEAAAVLLGEDGDGPTIALVIAAEAAVLRGRPSEARRHAARAMDQAGATIDETFAGMPRGPMWPADATMIASAAPTLFDAPALRPAAPSTTSAGRASGRDTEPATEPDAERTVEPATIALWEANDVPSQVAAPADVENGAVDLPSADDAFRSGTDALVADDVAAAAAHLGLVLRLAPARAPAVLDVIAGRTDRELAFLRGDAYRLVGRERDARRAFADAILPPAPPSSPADHRADADHPSEGDPA